MAFNDDHFLEKKFIEIRDTHNIKTVIETGTFYANTTKWLAANFEQVYTCEIDAKTYEVAKKELQGLDNVTHALADSRQFLKDVLPKMDEQFIIFLDAHWFENPLREEIELLAQFEKKPILIIHDFKVPGKPFGYDTYPGITYDFAYILPSIEKVYGDKFKYEYNTQATGAKRGCIFIYDSSQ